MGRVHHEQTNNGKNLHEFDNLHYGDVTVLEYMIKNRSTLDSPYLTRMFFDERDPYQASDVAVFKEMICVMYVDLDCLISKSNLTENEMFILEKYMMGYSELDMVKLFGLKDTNEPRTNLRNIVNKLKQINDEDRVDCLERRGIKFKTKVCKKCGMKKLISDFSKNKNAQDGYKNNCKECIAKGARE